MSDDQGALFDCAVVGGGPAGSAAALSLAAAGAPVALIGDGPEVSRPDTRTAALFSSSISLLERLGVWRELAPQCAELLAIRIVDDTGGILRAPEVTFRAGEVGLDRFGWNVPNAALNDVLWRAAGRAPGLNLMAGERANQIAIGPELATVRLSGGGSLRTRLLIGADGRNSISRRAAGIATREWSYEQAAITTIFEHGREHRGISTEFQGRGGPCTTVPLPGQASSLVWVERKPKAERLAELDDVSFRHELEAALKGVLGAVRTIAPRRCYPLSGLTALSMGQNRVALVGEAGHVMPPIGAQGLNLGLRDAAWIAQIAGEALRHGQDPGGPDALSAYQRARDGDVRMRIAAVDALNRSLLSGLLPISLARGLGLHVIAAMPPLRRALIEQGLAPGQLPRSMAPAG